MRRSNIKKLAESFASVDKISNNSAKFVLSNLSKEELKVFLSFYKVFLDRRRVYITSSSDIDRATMNNLKSIYKNYSLNVNVDKNLGAGIKIQHADMITDFTFKKYLEDTIEKLM